MTRMWASVSDLVATLRRRWEHGRYLREYASGSEWQPIALPVRSPTAAEMLDHFDEAVRWAERFNRDSRTAAGHPRFTVEHRVVSGKGLGANEVPARIRVETLEQLCALLGTKDEVRTLDLILDQTRRDAPLLVPWVTANPMSALQHALIWSQLVATVVWIAGRDTSHLYLRHIDVAGVDTKFVERHRLILGQLLTAALPAGRVDLSESTFARRFGFRPKPRYTRFRLLSPNCTFPSGVSEVHLRTEELAVLDLPIRSAFVVENEVSYLAFPKVLDAIVIFGEGFALTGLETLPWLHRKEIVYWGDIDTHGFAILDHLRARFANVQSILMDHATLLAHPDQLVTEESPTVDPRPHLTEAEQSLYCDLIEDRYGRNVRLEQERVRFSLLPKALAPWSTTLPP